MESYNLRYGTGSVEIAVSGERVKGVLVPKEPERLSDEKAEIERALENPIGSLGIEKIAKQGMKVAIMASDNTRPSPSYKLLPPLLARLSTVGIPDKDVTIVFGMGIHRLLTEEEKRKLVGDDIWQRYRCIESAASGRFVALGTTSRGTPIEVCPEVAECDLLICTGNIEYHYFAGYSGGAKAVLPGACSERTVSANHSMQLMSGAEIGSYDNNPVRQDIEEAGRIIGVDFILNVVLDEKKNIVKAVAGHPVEALAIGRKAVDDLYGIGIDSEADIVLVSAGGRPKDINLYQAQKALENATRAVRRGGVIVLLAECPEVFGEKTFEQYMTGYPLDEIIERIRQNFVLGGHKAAAIARTVKKARVNLVSSIDPKTVHESKMNPFSSPKEALDDAFALLGENASVVVMPYGGSTVPFPGRGGGSR